jgi:hypothetical protein
MVGGPERAWSPLRSLSQPRGRRAYRLFSALTGLPFMVSALASQELSGFRAQPGATLHGALASLCADARFRRGR